MAHIPSVELLKSTHVFPGPYVFKAIGAMEGDFASLVLAVSRGDLVQSAETSQRHSADGRYVAVTLTVQVASAEAVVQLYERLLAVPGLKMLL